MDDVVEVEMGEDEESGESGIRTTRKTREPADPTQDEILEHNKTHLPYRSWCKDCARGRGLQLPHHRQDGQEGGLQELHMDFCFMGDENMPGKTMPVLVAKIKGSRMKMSAVIPKKTSGAYISKRLMAFLGETGTMQGDIIVKSDQESAIKKVVTDLGRLRAEAGGGRYVVEHSPVGSSASNGGIERAILSVE